MSTVATRRISASTGRRRRQFRRLERRRPADLGRHRHLVHRFQGPLRRSRCELDHVQLELPSSGAGSSVHVIRLSTKTSTSHPMQFNSNIVSIQRSGSHGIFVPLDDRAGHRRTDGLGPVQRYRQQPRRRRHQRRIRLLQYGNALCQQSTADNARVFRSINRSSSARTRPIRSTAPIHRPPVTAPSFRSATRKTIRSKSG